MKIIDTNSVDYIFSHNLKVKDTYYLSPDVKEESEVTEQIHGKKLPSNIKAISNEHFFNEAVYVGHYQDMLNKHNNRSFYNMTGFGDVSILALLKTLIDYYKGQPRKLFEDMEEELVVFTGDNKLIKKIQKEFNSTGTTNLWQVTVLDNSAIS
jgi:hypothetical protein